MPKKMLLIGWDAADWAIINPLLRQGKLPALAGLLANGCWGNIATLDPPISPMLWTSIATAKRPHKHGIHGFTEAGPDGKARPVRVTSRTAKAVWNILNDKGLKTNVVGWWPSHPAEEVNGVMVSNFFGIEASSEVLREAVHPASLAEVLAQCIVRPEELTPEILQPFFPEAEPLNSETDGILRSVMRILAQTATTHAAATYVLENTEWQFAAVYYDAIDHFSHLAMKYHPPQMAGISDVTFKNYCYIVEAAYRFCDMLLERLLALAGSTCHVVLVSDHGFESGEKRWQTLPDEPGAPALEHNPYGIFIASGPAFKRGPMYGASLLDVTPTILHFYNQPVAEDMDGRILPIFSDEKVTATVKTYEEGGLKKYKPEISSTIDDVLMQQLADLGYVNLPETGASETILAENEYYLARSLSDAGLLEEALQKINRLCAAFKDVQRYQRFRLALLLQLGNSLAVEEQLASLTEGSYKVYITGLLWLQKGMPQKAAEIFQALGESNNTELLAKTAQAWLQAGNTALAQYFAEKAVETDPQNSLALNTLGEVRFQQERWEDALSHYFRSLALLYYQPLIHQNIGICLYHLGFFADAAMALELAAQFRPGLLAAKDMLKTIYETHLSNPEKLAQLIAEESGDMPIVVTGLPRSGTSLVMQMLQAAGVTIATDGQRKADTHNPQGYLELEAVKNIAQNQDFLQDVGGKAIKIVLPLLRVVRPFQPLRVIWVQRDVAHVLRSQQTMKGENMVNAPLNLILKMNEELHLTEQWLNRYPHISYLKLDYEALISDTLRQVKKLADFIGHPGATAAMTAVVDASLNRSSR